MPVVVMTAMRLRPRPQCPGEKEEAAASCEVAERGQKDGDPVANRRREVDQTLHDRDYPNVGFLSEFRKCATRLPVGLREITGHWMLPCSIVTTQAVPRCPIEVIFP